MKKLRAVARRLHVERQAVAIRRRFLPAHVRADIRDYELMTTLFERVLEPDNDCLDVGANEGKGPDNDDWVRSRRQQEFIAATIKAVGQSEIAGLVSTAQGDGAGKWWTNYPISTTSAMDLYNEFQGASLGTHVVWKPGVFAARIPGTSAYELKLTAVRQWSAQYLK